MGTQLERRDPSERDLDLMERRSEAATPGPWISFVVGRDLEAGLDYIEVAYCGAMEVIGGTVADQDFIANAREDVPRLIREVRRLRAEIRMRTTPLTASAAARAVDTATVSASASPIPTTC